MAIKPRMVRLRTFHNIDIELIGRYLLKKEVTRILRQSACVLRIIEEIVEKAKDAWLDFVRASRLVRIEPDEDSCNSFWCDMKVFHSIGGSRKARKMGLVIEAE